MADPILTEKAIDRNQDKYLIYLAALMCEAIEDLEPDFIKSGISKKHAFKHLQDIKSKFAGILLNPTKEDA